jgi:hypothetical protein
VLMGPSRPCVQFDPKSRLELRQGLRPGLESRLRVR